MRIETVTALSRRTTELLAELERSEEPILLTRKGVPVAYLLGVEAFESLKNRLEILEGIGRGEAAIEEGQTLLHAEARSRMAQWLRPVESVRP